MPETRMVAGFLRHEYPHRLWELFAIIPVITGQNAVYSAVHYWGRYGFDDGNEPCGACRDDSESR